MKKILIMGLPGSGKTTLAKMIKWQLKAVHFNADEVRKNINKDLGFTREDRVEQARRMGWLCDRVIESGAYVIAEFVCPTRATRKAFGTHNSIVIWLDRDNACQYADTLTMFEPPTEFDLRLREGTPIDWQQAALDYIFMQNEIIWDGHALL